MSSSVIYLAQVLPGVFITIDGLTTTDARLAAKFETIEKATAFCLLHLGR